MRTAPTALILAAAIAAHAPAGDLTPPPGPPAPTMKPLDRVEPRVAITQADVPLTITEPGSYYLAGHVSGVPSAITIAADNVSLDLMGFTVSAGPEPHTAPIHVAACRAVAIRNGHVVAGARGVTLAEGATDVLLEDLAFAKDDTSHTATAGVQTVGVTSGVTIRRCSMRDLDVAIDFSGTFPSSHVTIADCTVARCANGFLVASVDRGSIARCRVSGAEHVGIFVYNSAGVHVDECTVAGAEIGVRLTGSVSSLVTRTVALDAVTHFLDVPNVATSHATARPHDNLAH